MGIIFGRPTQVLVLPLVLLLLDIGPTGAFQNLRHPGTTTTTTTTTTVRVGRDLNYRTRTTSWDARNAQSVCHSYKNSHQPSASLIAGTLLPRRSHLFSAGVIGSIQQQQHQQRGGGGGTPMLLRLADKDSDVLSGNASNSKRVRILSMTKRILFYPFRKVATLFRRTKPNLLDTMNSNGEGEGEDKKELPVVLDFDDSSTSISSSSSSSSSSKDKSLMSPTTLTPTVMVVTTDVVDDALQVLDPLSSPPLMTTTTVGVKADSPNGETSNDSPPTTPIESESASTGASEIKSNNNDMDNNMDNDIIVGDRWAVAAPSVDLTGEWDIKPLMTETFKGQYDNYLKLLGQPSLVRSVAVSIVGMTTEETVQSEQGRELLIRGRNVRGLWERTLTASGADRASEKFIPLRTFIITADDEKVEAEAWWEQNGTVHRSWLRGVTKYGGGEFESKRYLEDDGNVLVCESTFHPADPSREKAQVKWRFQRQAAAA